MKSFYYCIMTELSSTTYHYESNYLVLIQWPCHKFVTLIGYPWSLWDNIYSSNMIIFYLMVTITSFFMKSQSLSNSDQVIHHKDGRPMATLTFHQPCFGLWIPLLWMAHTTEVEYPTHQLSVPYLFEFRLLLTLKCTSHAYIVRIHLGFRYVTL